MKKKDSGNSSGSGCLIYAVLILIVLGAIVRIFETVFQFLWEIIHTLPGFMAIFWAVVVFAFILVTKIYAKIRYKCGVIDYFKWKIKKMKEEDELENADTLSVDCTPEEEHAVESKEKLIQKQDPVGIKKEAEHIAEGICGVVSQKEKFNISAYLSGKQDASALISKMEKIADEMNNLSIDTSRLYQLKGELIGYFNALIRLNEVDGITMFPAPRGQKDEILKNWPNTINDFIDRSVSEIRKKYDKDKIVDSVLDFLSMLKMICQNHGAEFNENSESKIKMLENSSNSVEEFEYAVDFDLSVRKLLSDGKIDIYNVMMATKLKSSYDKADKIISDMEFLKIISSERKPIISYEKYFSMRPSLSKMLGGIEAEKARIKEEEERREKLRLEIEERDRMKEKLLSSIGSSKNLDVSHIDAMSVILAMEKTIKEEYDFFIQVGLSSITGQELFNNFKDCCLSSKLPLAAEIRLESLLEEYEGKFNVPNPMCAVDRMEGHDFERWCADLLRKSGFTDVEVTKGSGDQGVDVIAVKDGIRYAIQCKCYSSDLGNKPVQEVHAGKVLYRCQVGVVMTNRHFTAGAKELADATGVLLWDREKLIEMMGTCETPSVV